MWFLHEQLSAQLAGYRVACFVCESNDLSGVYVENEVVVKAVGNKRLLEAQAY